MKNRLPEPRYNDETMSEAIPVLNEKPIENKQSVISS